MLAMVLEVGSDAIFVAVLDCNNIRQIGLVAVCLLLHIHTVQLEPLEAIGVVLMSFPRTLCRIFEGCWTWSWKNAFAEHGSHFEWLPRASSGEDVQARST